MTTGAKISIKNLNFYYQKAQAIIDLSLDVAENEILAVFGPAGSGITTLLRVLNRMGELTPGTRIEGQILMDGKNIYAPDVSVTEHRRKVGMVFETPSPLPMSILDNIAYGPRLSGLKSKSEVLELAESSLRMAALWNEVKDRLQMSATSLSGGQQQRLCIARVLALRPEVILLDRPCAALDPISTAMIEDSLQMLKAQYTIVIAPHSISQAGRISDHAAFLLMGALIEEGETVTLFSDPAEQQTYDYITGRFG